MTDKDKLFICRLLRELKTALFFIDTYSAEAKNSFRAGGNGKYIDDLIACTYEHLSEWSDDGD